MQTRHLVQEDETKNYRRQSFQQEFDERQRGNPTLAQLLNDVRTAHIATTILP